MAAKKSKAAAAAAKVSGKPPSDVRPPDGVWTRAMVERAIAAFNDLASTPAWDDEKVAALVADFYRFVDVVARGDVELEALALAAEMVRLGHAWLEKNPRFIPVQTPVWDRALVEGTVRWFGAATQTEPTDKELKELVARCSAFERVLRSGFVEPGETSLIAQAFVEHVHGWLDKNPDAKKLWDALG